MSITVCRRLFLSPRLAALVSSQPGLAQPSPATAPADAALRAGQFDRAATLLEQAAKAGAQSSRAQTRGRARHGLDFDTGILALTPSAA
jgi:hypothetical protein